MNPYEVLGVEKDASPDDIKKAYRKLSKEHHPDMGGDEEKFKDVASAYDILSNPEKKQKYDMFGEGGPSFQGGDPFDIFSSIFGGGNPLHKQSRRGSDIGTIVKVTLMEVLLGVNKNITYPRDIKCEPCKGLGGEDAVKCNACNGTGQTMRQMQTAFGVVQTSMPCNACNSTGSIVKTPCKSCKGSGVSPKVENITVTIPAGVHNGMQFPMRGAGNMIRNGATGDLYIKIEEIPDTNFKRETFTGPHGDMITNNLVHDLWISISEAVLGTEKVVKAPLGDLRFNIEAGCDSGKVFKFAGKGIPVISQDGHGYGSGHLLVKVNVIIPKTVNKETKKIFEDLKKYDGKQ